MTQMSVERRASLRLPARGAARPLHGPLWIVALVGALPIWPYSQARADASGLVLVILLLWVLLGRGVRCIALRSEGAGTRR
jgi:hypothetical protein